MTDEIALNKEITRGAQAEALMRNEILTEAFDYLRSEYLKAWEHSPALDSPSREKLWQAVQIVTKVKDHIERVVTNGKVAQKELDFRSVRTRKSET